MSLTLYPPFLWSETDKGPQLADRFLNYFQRYEPQITAYFEEISRARHSYDYQNACWKRRFPTAEVARAAIKEWAESIQKWSDHYRDLEELSKQLEAPFNKLKKKSVVKEWGQLEFIDEPLKETLCQKYLALKTNIDAISKTMDAIQLTLQTAKEEIPWILGHPHAKALKYLAKIEAKAPQPGYLEELWNQACRHASDVWYPPAIPQRSRSSQSSSHTPSPQQSGTPRTIHTQQQRSYSFSSTQTPSSGSQWPFTYQVRNDWPGSSSAPSNGSQ